MLLAGAAALVLVVVATALVMGDRFTCGGPASGVREFQGACVGVTDGSFVFDDEFGVVSERIKEENDRVAALDDGRPVVRVAFLGTLSFDGVGPMDPVRMRGALEGAYTAQIRANDTRAFGDPTPQIQLVLANMGGRQEGRGPVVEDLVAMARDEERPLVAVTGLGVSIESTREVAEELHRHEVPMISSALTADGLAHGPGGIDDAGTEDDPALAGVIRVAPSNNEYVEALKAYLEGLDDPARAVVVHDQTQPDLFVSTLKTAFDEHLDTYTEGRAVQTYAGTTVGDTPPSGLFSDVSGNVCATDADTVLFAGRAPDLDAFLDSLRYSVCDRPLRILFVSTGMSMLNQEEEMSILEEQDITLVYATGQDPRWNDAPAGSPDVPEGYADFLEAYRGHFDEHDPDLARLRNGYALVNHDAVAVAAAAIRMTNEQGSEGETPTAEAVHARLMLLNTLNNQVKAGGGTLTYSPEGAGEATGRYVPIVELPLSDATGPEPDPHVIGD
nr:hypothetical protein [Nocardiopsis sp. MG754419]